MRALASRSLDSADVCVGHWHSSPDRRQPVQRGRFPSHLTFRDLQLKQANPYRRAFRADEDAEPEAGPWAKPRPRPGLDAVPGVEFDPATGAATEAEGMGDLGVVEGTGVAAPSPSDSLAEVLIRAW